MKEKNKSLPFLGIGPALCFPMGVITAVAIILSVDGFIPGCLTNQIINNVLLGLGIFLIIEGCIMFVGADYNGGLRENIKKNTLKTNGSYQFVRNPCYSVYLLGCTGAILIAHNIILFILPPLFWLEMTVVLKHTEEKWLVKLYGEEYIAYCSKVNRCIPWFFYKK